MQILGVICIQNSFKVRDFKKFTISSESKYVLGNHGSRLTYISLYGHNLESHEQSVRTA